jgi:RsiW-degrading membrane proteinase PrsW (M82 family)
MTELACLIYGSVPVTLAIAFVPIWLWLYFLGREESHPEPTLRLVGIFILGLLALIASYYGEAGLELIGLTEKTAPGLYYFYSAIIEELAKFLFVFVFVFLWRVYHTPIDAMIYMGVASLGFAFFENVGVLCNSALLDSNTLAIIAGLRFLGANFLHLLASVLIGFGYAVALISRRLIPLILSFVFAVSLHFLYNMLIIQDNGFGYVIPILWAVFFIVLKEFNFIKVTDERLRPHPLS